MTLTLTRRRLLRYGALSAGSLALAGCDPFGNSRPVRNFLLRAEDLTMAAQRALLDRTALAREFSESDIIQPMRPNGSTNVQDEAYHALWDSGFAGWTLPVTGLVEKPVSLSLDELRNMPSRTQITRHDCVEGWSCIARWTGVPLSLVLDQAHVKPQAKFIVFQCFDTMENSFTGPVKYYESIDMIDARHPQTILAYVANGETLPIPLGAPLRVRVERQLGYKMAKFIRAIELVDDLSLYGRGKGSYWADRGYEWYAGI
jgi:DMSO/TMAO reductase YedYZ molybdopterin-dependent catalytic subunit